MQNKKHFWQTKNVLVTGAGGFVGIRLVQKLLNLGAKTVAVFSASSSGLKGRKGKLFTEKCDLTKAEAVQKLFKKYRIDTVFHLAASSIVSQAAQEPWPTIQNNVLATLNVLEVCRLYKVKRILLASSDKAYGDHEIDELEGLPYRETYALRGMDVYSASKVCADTLAQAYAFQYKMPIGVARCCNIYGPGDTNFTRLIPRVAMQLLSGQPPIIKLGHENVLREYLYIDDAVNAYVFLAEHIEKYYGAAGENMPVKGKETYGWIAFNVGSYTKKQTKNLAVCESIKSVKEIMRELREKIADIEPRIVRKPAQYLEIPDEYLDSSKIISLGFRTKTAFSHGLEQAVAWYRDNYESLRKEFEHTLKTLT